MAASLQSPLLHVPTKRTDEVDFTTPFRSYISSVYQDDPDKYATEIATLHRLRQDSRGAGKDVTGRDILYRYYGQLELLDLRFPVDEKHVKVLFTWYDAFSQKAISQYSIAYEKACIIFNIAATCSSIGALQNRFEVSGLKMAFNYLQAAAGLFLYINDNFLHAPSVDLSRDSVKTLVDLMLGQAQECFLEKVILEKKQGALVAKLAAQAAHVYQNVADGLSHESIRPQFDRAWIELVKVKAKHFQAVAQYHKSLQCEADGKYGENVAYLTSAENISKEANKMATAFSGSFPSFTTSVTTSTSSSGSSGHTTAAAAALLEATKTSLNLITERKTVAIKDNDMIYHDNVPKIETLPAIEKLNAVKPATFADLLPNGQADIPKIIGADIFQRLVPLSVHESASLYSEEKAKILRAEQERVEAANEELQATLDSMNLVQTLDKLKRLTKNPGSVNEGISMPDQVKQWNAAVRASEDSGTRTDELLGLLDGFKWKVREFLDEIGLMLDKEQSDCEGMRVKFAELWTQEPSVQFTAKIRDDVRQHREAYDKAIATDLTLMSGLEESKSNIDILKRQLEDVESIFVERLMFSTSSRKSSKVGSLIDDTVDGSGGFGVLNEQILIEKMDGLLSRLRSLKKERADVLQELKTKIHQDDISSLLILNKNKESQVFQTELSKFMPLQSRLSANLQAHAQFIRDLGADFAKLESSSESIKSLGSMEKRTAELVKEWGRSFQQWKEAKEGLTRGVDFYSGLCNLVESLRATVLAFVKQRSLERDELAKRLENEVAERRQRTLREQLQRLSVGSSATIGTTPPPLQTATSVQSPSAPLDTSTGAAQYQMAPSAVPTNAYGGQYPSRPPVQINRPEIQPFAPPPPSPLTTQAPTLAFSPHSGAATTYFPPPQNPAGGKVPTSPPSPAGQALYGAAGSHPANVTLERPGTAMAPTGYTPVSTGFNPALQTGRPPLQSTPSYPAGAQHATNTAFPNGQAQTAPFNHRPLATASGYQPTYQAYASQPVLPHAAQIAPAQQHTVPTSTYQSPQPAYQQQFSQPQHAYQSHHGYSQQSSGPTGQSIGHGPAIPSKVNQQDARPGFGAVSPYGAAPPPIPPKSFSSNTLDGQQAQNAGLSSSHGTTALYRPPVQHPGHSAYIPPASHAQQYHPNPAQHPTQAFSGPQPSTQVQAYQISQPSPQQSYPQQNRPPHVYGQHIPQSGMPVYNGGYSPQLGPPSAGYNPSTQQPPAPQYGVGYGSQPQQVPPPSQNQYGQTPGPYGIQQQVPQQLPHGAALQVAGPYMPAQNAMPSQPPLQPAPAQGPWNAEAARGSLLD